jgi:uncharacterized membrane protein YtjA (UPF0391 family)
MLYDAIEAIVEAILTTVEFFEKRRNMTWTIILLLLAILGAFTYCTATNGKVADMGKILFMVSLSLLLYSMSILGRKL